MQANASAQGFVVFLLMGSRCHGGIGSHLLIELRVIAGAFNYLFSLWTRASGALQWQLWNFVA